MYPKLSDLINDLFGTNINLPIQSYGFFLGLAFLVGALILYYELQRKEKEGLIPTTFRKVWKGKPATINELIFNFVVSMLIGYKMVYAFFNYSYFANNPQEFLLSTDGSWPGGLVVGVVFTIYFYFKKNKSKLNPPVEEEIEVHANEHTWPIVFVAVVFGIIGAKLFHWFENWDEFMADPIDSLTSFSGLTFYGGLIVASFAVVFYSEKNKIPWKHIADIVAPALIIAYGIGRIGCHVSGDGDWGIVNNMPKPEWLAFLPDWMWAYNYPHNIISEGVRIPGCEGVHCFQLPEPVFPTAIYETIMTVFILIFLWSIRKRIKIPGQLFAIYLMFNGVERFLIEKIRVNNVFDFLGMHVTQAEVISTILFLIGLIMFFVFRKINKSAVV
jgi:prolipoprotein diacylglyceryl transferase